MHLETSNLVHRLTITSPSLLIKKPSLKGSGSHGPFWNFIPLEISLERLKLVTSDFLYELATLSISLGLTDCPLSGRGQGQASNFYILGLENFASKSSVYWRDQQTRRQSACGLHQRQSSTSWLNAQAYYMLVSCNPLTTLL